MRRLTAIVRFPASVLAEIRELRDAAASIVRDLEAADERARRES